MDEIRFPAILGKIGRTRLPISIRKMKPFRFPATDPGMCVCVNRAEIISIIERSTVGIK